VKDSVTAAADTSGLRPVIRDSRPAEAEVEDSSLAEPIPQPTPEPTPATPDSATLAAEKRNRRQNTIPLLSAMAAALGSSPEELVDGDAPAPLAPGKAPEQPRADASWERSDGSWEEAEQPEADASWEEADGSGDEPEQLQLAREEPEEDPVAVPGTVMGFTEEAGRWEVGLASEPWGGWDSAEPEAEIARTEGGSSWWPWGKEAPQRGSAVDVGRRASAVLDADRRCVQGDAKSSLGDAKGSLGDAKGSLGDAERMLGDAKSSLRDAESSLGDAESSLGDAKGSLGDAKGLLGDAKSSLGDAKGSLGDAKGSLGDAKGSLGDAKSSLGDAKSSLGGVCIAARRRTSTT
jgi:hypothetical protein